MLKPVPGTTTYPMKKVRIDKWLWSVRLFKTRSKATEACRNGRVRIQGEAVKASYLLTEGELIEVRKDGFTFQYKALKLIGKRVGAPIATTCYENLTPEEELRKYENWFTSGYIAVERREKGTGRPTKKERREIEKWKDL